MATVRKRTWQNKNGEQTAYIVDYTDQADKRHIETFATRKAAKDRLAEIQHEVRQGIHTPSRASITVAQAGEEWITQAETDGLEPSTVLQYRQHLRYHIAPFIGRKKLAELAPANVMSFRNDLIKEGRSRVMSQKVVGSLGEILANAMANGKVARNVVREQVRQHGQRQRRLEKRHDVRLEVGSDIPTKDEIRAMLAYAQGRIRPLVVAAIFTGLRASELRGLTWADVDLDRARLTVRRRADRWGQIGSPKSDAGKREIPLAPMVVNTLREWKLGCPKGALDLVFPNGHGKVESLPNLHRRGLGALQEAAGISAADHPKYGLHAFRHAAASLFVEQGFSPKRVQVLMGHSTIQVTFDTYGHLFPSQDEDQAAMQQLQARLVG